LKPFGWLRALFLNRGSTDPWGCTSWVDSTLFLCCIAVRFKLFSSHFLLPHWSKKHKLHRTWKKH
jgi:hypothetical protein